MPDQFSEKIKSIHEVEFPENLHGKIMRKLAFLQFRTPFLIVVSLLILNLLVSGWYIWFKLSGAEAFSTLKILLAGMDFSWSSFSDVWDAAQDLFPLGLMANFAINMLLVVYLLVVVNNFKKLPQKM